jgi:uncharacterized protein (TIGR02246 family)
MAQLSTNFLSFLSIAGVVPLIVSLAAMQSDQKPEEAPLRAIVQTLEDGWNAGDATKFASPFAEDADYVIVNGQLIRTRAVIDFGHKQIFGAIYKGSKNKATIKQIRFLRPDVAVIHVEWNLIYGEKLENKSKAMNSIVALKNSGKWEIAAFHNTPVTN